MNTSAGKLLGAAVIAALPLFMHAQAFAQGAANQAHEAHHGSDGGKTAETMGQDQAAGEMTEGEVRRINLDTQKITLRHGELKKLGMPPMTMVFGVTDPALLEQVKVGDKVKFDVEQVDGRFIVTRIEADN